MSSKRAKACLIFRLSVRVQNTPRGKERGGQPFFCPSLESVKARPIDPLYFWETQIRGVRKVTKGINRRRTATATLGAPAREPGSLFPCVCGQSQRASRQTVSRRLCYRSLVEKNVARSSGTIFLGNTPGCWKDLESWRVPSVPGQHPGVKHDSTCG